VWRSVWRCKLDCSMYGVLCGDVRWTAVCMAFCVERSVQHTSPHRTPHLCDAPIFRPEDSYLLCVCMQLNVIRCNSNSPLLQLVVRQRSDFDEDMRTYREVGVQIHILSTSPLDLCER